LHAEAPCVVVAMVASDYMLQLVWFFALVFVQSTAILLYKLCQVDGKYEFSPASNVAMTEICKLCLATMLHWQYCRREAKAWWSGVNPKIIIHYCLLSLLYTVNNQLSFYVLLVADPGSMALGKSISPYMCAALLRFSGQRINKLQWVCIVVQCCAIAIVQYDVCKNAGILSTQAYTLIAAATSITAVTSVWNQLVIKGFDVPVNLQNAIMYFFGTLIAGGFYVRSTYEPGPTKGFFEGYNWLALLLVLFQAFHGIAVGFVYKYADAIVKNFAASSVVAILCVVSFYFFAAPTNIHSWLGIVIILATTYSYMNIALRLPTSGAPADPKPPQPLEKARLLEEEVEAGKELEAGSDSNSGDKTSA